MQRGGGLGAHTNQCICQLKPRVGESQECRNRPLKLLQIYLKTCDLVQAPVVQKLDSAIHRINLYPLDNY